jgi:hypothetical protein
MERVERTMRKFGSQELFHLAARNQPAVGEQEADLLTGLSE